jgi:hypothetical protein
MPIEPGDGIRIKAGWHDEGKVGIALTSAIRVHGMDWIGVEWEEDEDPDWHKAEGLEYL